VAMGGTISLDEDTTFEGQVVGFELGRSALTYSVVAQPAHGTVTLDASAGNFRYQPTKDFNGSDSFTFIASDGESSSGAATVSILVKPVDDPPDLPVIEDQTNSAETLETFIALPQRDVDGDLVEYAVSVASPSVADAFVDQGATLVVVPKARGTTQITVLASDGTLQVSTSFQFTVTNATKTRLFDVAVPREKAVTITNTCGHDVAFELTHNGHLLATTGDQLVQEVRSLPDELPGEPFERKLWKFVATTSYYSEPITGAVWQHDPLLFENSVGLGFCDDVTAVYVSLARAAGYPARGWDLQGHVVPEVQVDGRWSMYDPALAVYYLEPGGGIADVGALASAPTLITDPIERVNSWWYPYSAEIAQVYAAGVGKVIGSWLYAGPRNVGTLVLPRDARVTYPGRWSTSPMTLSGKALPVTAQLRLEVPAEFTGTIDWPLVPWDVIGTGRVRVDGVEYDAGSSELRVKLQDVTSPRDPVKGRPIGIVSARTPLAVVYLLNPMRFTLTGSTDLRVTSIDAWALQVQLVPQDPGATLTYDKTDDVARPF
jgi:hypothetical protein